MNKTQYTFILSSQSPVPNPQSLTSTSDSEIKSDCYSYILPNNKCTTKICITLAGVNYCWAGGE
ncbi:hypothetical protein GXM_02870 [Nostoc sphaeroides CCNUC1]|uniref:Uncharacterized protein n=1 Tax=Nostoc sphaeroides CCNUC1 TaxID=2653204 RepID=A0A5P8VY73_9NOSO|nr:hypothetical protein GXM_02870 [Nostoc sphaeroides CCNUC1]